MTIQYTTHDYTTILPHGKPRATVITVRHIAQVYGIYKGPLSYK